MHSILGLVLILTLSAKAGAAANRNPAQKGPDQSVARPDWAKGLPSDSTSEYIKELRKRIAEGQIVHVRAAVRSFLPIALSSQNKDHSPGVHVSGAMVEVVSPAQYKGLQLLVHHHKAQVTGSCWRVVGCKIEFDFPDRQLEARQMKLPGLLFLYDRDLKNVTLGAPSPEKAATPTVGKDGGS